MPGPGTKGGGGTRQKCKKEPEVDNSDDDESLDKFGDQVRMKSKGCTSAGDNPPVRPVRLLSPPPPPCSATNSPSKKPASCSEVGPNVIHAPQHSLYSCTIAD